MQVFDEVLAWIVEIGAVVVIMVGSVMWLVTAVRGRSTARSFMALVFTAVFFLVVVLRAGEFEQATIRWLAASYAAVASVYVVARAVGQRRGTRINTDAPEEIGASPSSSVLMDELESEPTIDTHGISVQVRPRGIFRRKKCIEISGVINSQKAKDLVTQIAMRHASDAYDVTNDLVIQ